jgi:hypothetical protein
MQVARKIAAKGYCDLSAILWRAWRLILHERCVLFASPQESVSQLVSQSQLRLCLASATFRNPC